MAEELVKDVVGDHVRDNSSNHNEKDDGDFEDKAKANASICPSQGIGESLVTIGDGTSCSDLPSDLKSSTSSSSSQFKVKVKDWFTQTDINRNRINGTDVTTQAGQIETREKLHEALLAYCQDTQSQTELQLLTIQHDYSYFGVDVAVQNGNGPGIDIATQKENLGIDIAIETVQKDQKNISTQKPCEPFSSTSTSTSTWTFENVASQTEKARRQFTQDMLTQYEEIDTLSFPEPMLMTHKEGESVKLILKKQTNSNDEMMTLYDDDEVYEYESLPTNSYNFLDNQEEEKEEKEDLLETDGFIQPGKIRDSLVTKQMKNSLASCLREQIESLSLNSYSSHHDSAIQRLLNQSEEIKLNDDERNFSTLVKPMEMGIENYEQEKEEDEQVIRNNFVQVYKPTIRKKKTERSRKYCLIS